jgi:hypothetical protein
MLGEIQGKYASSACQVIGEDEFDFNPGCGVSLDIACNVQCHHRTTCRWRLPLARGKFGASGRNTGRTLPGTSQWHRLMCDDEAPISP